MSSIQAVDGGRVLHNKIYIGNEDVSYPIILRTTKGDVMKYGKEMTRQIDFPGEYDIQGIGITCMDAGGSLHYVLRIDGVMIALLFDKAVLEKESFDEIDQRRCIDESVKTLVEKMELDGDIYVFGDEERPVTEKSKASRSQSSDDDE